MNNPECGQELLFYYPRSRGERPSNSYYRPEEPVTFFPQNEVEAMARKRTSDQIAKDSNLSTSPLPSRPPSPSILYSTRMVRQRRTTTSDITMDKPFLNAALPLPTPTNSPLGGVENKRVIAFEGSLWERLKLEGQSCIPELCSPITMGI